MSDLVSKINKYHFLVIIIMNNYSILFPLAAMISAIPPILIKEYNSRKLTHPDTIYIFILGAAIASMILLFLYTKIFDGHDIGTFYALSKILSIIVVIFSGILFFEEILTTKKIMGIIFAIIAIVLLIT